MAMNIFLLAMLKEITYKTSHSPPLKHHPIRAYAIDQEPLSATKRHTTLGSVLGYKYERKRDITLFHTLQTVQVRR